MSEVQVTATVAALNNKNNLNINNEYKLKIILLTQQLPRKHFISKANN